MKTNWKKAQEKAHKTSKSAKTFTKVKLNKKDIWSE